MATQQLNTRFNSVRRLAMIIFLVTVAPTVFFGLRSYGSFRLLRSAYEAGAPTTSSIRGWMTLRYIAATYRVPETALVEALQLSPQTDPNTTLKTFTDRAGTSPSAYVQRVQRVIAALSMTAPMGQSTGNSSWLSAIEDDVLTAVLIYGYPALGLTLLLGAIGLPLPDGVATIVAGSLASQHRIDWFSAAAIVVIASVLGDTIGYGLGRLLSQKFLERHGHWFGYTLARRERVRMLFDRWSLLTVFITRTFVSYLSSIASLLAGVSRYRLPRFLVIAFLGRLIWTAGYFGLGYAIGADWEAATSFLTNLSVLLVLVVILIGSGAVTAGRLVSPSGA